MALNESGYSIISVMIAVSVISATFLAVLPIIEQQRKHASQINTSLSLTAARSTMTALIKNPSAWNSIVQDANCNSSLRCIRDGTDCASALPDIEEEYPINCIYDASGSSVVINTQQKGAGFDLGGQPCTSSLIAGQRVNCPIQPRITWKLQCRAAPCIGSPIQVNVAFELHFDSHIQINTSRFAFSELR